VTLLGWPEAHSWTRSRVHHQEPNRGKPDCSAHDKNSGAGKLQPSAHVLGVSGLLVPALNQTLVRLSLSQCGSLYECGSMPLMAGGPELADQG